MDRLYAQSVRLSDFHVDPMCAPTRAALMTGRYSVRTGVWSTLNGCNIPRREEITMAHIFSRSGYRTAMFGKWHLGDEYPYGAEHRGFQHVVRFNGGVIGEVPDAWNNDYFDDRYLKNGKWKRFKGFCTDIWIDECIEYIRSHRDKPFFCYLATNAPHGPFNVHDKYSQPYVAAGVPVRRARFYGLIANLDKNLGRLMDFLEKENLAENTIFIFMGDNGTAAGVSRNGLTGFCRSISIKNGYNAGMRGTKTWPYDGGHRSFCFIRYPAAEIQGGRDIDGLTAHFDLMPTLIELCGLKKPDVKFDGISLVPQLSGRKKVSDRTLVVHNMQLLKPQKYKDFTVMTNRWRLVNNSRLNKTPKFELFDMTCDSGQTTDVASQYPEMVERLKCFYENWWREMIPNFQNISYHVVGSEHANNMLLTCHSWRTASREKSYNQRHVREGIAVNDAWWPVEVARDGIYHIELRRWPRDADAPIAGTVPATAEPFCEKQPAGKVYHITHARLNVQNFDKTVVVKKNDKAAIFTVPLKKGKTRLRSWFTLDDGQAINAYYVYIERI